MNNLTVRVLFAFVAMPVFSAACWAGEYGHLLLMALLVVGGSWEYARMTETKFPLPGIQLIVIISALLMMLAMGKSGHVSVSLAIFGITLLVLILRTFQKVDIDKIFPTIAIHGFGLFFFGFWSNLVWPLFTPEFGWEACYPFLFVATSMWVCDSGAYFAGKFLGKKKMCPSISPKKTWMGAIGGAFFTLIWSYFLGPKMLETSILVALLIGLLMSVTAPVGDLLFSCAKRYTGVKDSSNIFPGHGGVLDRFDSFFLSAPMVALTMVLIGEFS